MKSINVTKTSKKTAKPTPSGMRVLSKYGVLLRKDQGGASDDTEGRIDDESDDTSAQLLIVIGISPGDGHLNGILSFIGDIVHSNDDGARKFAVHGSTVFDWSELELEQAITDEFEDPIYGGPSSLATVDSIVFALLGEDDAEFSKHLNDWINSVVQIGLSTMITSGVVYTDGSLKPWLI